MSVGLCGHRKLSVPSLHSCRYFGVSDQRPLPPPQLIGAQLLVPFCCLKVALTSEGKEQRTDSQAVAPPGP